MNIIDKSLKNKLLKINELAKRSIGGEALSAQHNLAALLKKHNIEYRNLIKTTDNVVDVVSSISHPTILLLNEVRSLRLEGIEFITMRNSEGLTIIHQNLYGQIIGTENYPQIIFSSSNAAFPTLDEFEEGFFDYSHRPEQYVVYPSTPEEINMFAELKINKRKLNEK